jgi:DUF1680 family protein
MKSFSGLFLLGAVSCVGTLPADTLAQAELFPLNRVRLLDSEFRKAQDVDRAYMLAHDVDRLLAPFRREAGLPAKAQPYGNWESTGLDGHTAGHYLSALASMWAATGDAEMKRRMDYMVDEFAACQKANGNGYVGGVPGSRQLWADVAEGKLKVGGFGLNDRWVPWYNVHKTFAGLRDAYLVGGNQQAKDVLIGLSNWCCDVLATLTDEQVQRMLRAEHGGMNEVLADVSAITGDNRYLAAAGRFCDLQILNPLVAGKDDLTGKHANTQIPKVIGFERIATLAGKPDMHRAATFFWENVTSKRSVAIGGNSVNEHFHRPDDYKAMLQDRTGPETCNTYNMLRLTEQLFTASPEPRFVDFYERALFNHILSTQHPAHGGYVYFTPMRPRHYRVYSQAGQGFWCCVGTGFENHARYGAFIYARGRADDLYVNLFVPSELDWQEQGATVRQETAFPDEPKTRLRLSLKSPKKLSLKVRHPWWVPAGELKVTINGKAEPVSSTPTSYVAVERTWSDGDVIDIHLPMRVTTEPLLGRANHVALLYGPIVLAAATGTEELRGLVAGPGRGDHVAPGPLLPLDRAPALVAAKPDDIAAMVKQALDSRLSFTIDGLTQPEVYQSLKLVPFSRVHDARYVLYWRVATPEAYASEQKVLAEEERKQLALEEATLDRVIPGTQQSEVDHAFTSDRSRTGNRNDRSWRDATGWFSYELKRPSIQGAELAITYFGGDRNRRFEILADGVSVANVELTGAKGNSFYTESYPLPAELIRNDERRMTVRFQAEDGSVAGGVFDVRVLRKPLSSIPQ